MKVGRLAQRAAILVGCTAVLTCMMMTSSAKAATTASTHVQNTQSAVVLTAQTTMVKPTAIVQRSAASCGGCWSAPTGDYYSGAPDTFCDYSNHTSWFWWGWVQAQFIDDGHWVNGGGVSQWQSYYVTYYDYLNGPTWSGYEYRWC
jgi:hypothetical protein